MDLCIEFTMNVSPKLKQGWILLLQSNTQLFCTIRNVNNVARIKAVLKNSLNCHRRHQKYVECQQDLILCKDDFDADSFDESVPEPLWLQSGVIASPEVLEDLQNALEQGEKQSNDILEKRVFSKELSLKARITKNKRLNLATTDINNAKTCSNAVDMERDVLAMVIVLGEKKISLPLNRH